MLFGGLTLVSPRNHVLDVGGPDGTNPFAAMRGEKSAMPSFDKLHWTLVITINAFTINTIPV